MAGTPLSRVEKSTAQCLSSVYLCLSYYYFFPPKIMCFVLVPVAQNLWHLEGKWEASPSLTAEPEMCHSQESMSLGCDYYYFIMIIAAIVCRTFGLCQEVYYILYLLIFMCLMMHLNFREVKGLYKSPDTKELLHNLRSKNQTQE